MTDAIEILRQMEVRPFAATARSPRRQLWRVVAAMSFWAAIAMAATVASVKAAPPLSDVYGAAPDGDEALLRDAAFAKPASLERLRQRLAAGAGATSHSDFAVRAWEFLCAASYHHGLYHQAIADCRAALALDPAADARDTLAIVERFADEPAPAREGAGARVAFDADHRIALRAGAFDGRAIVDTGAQITVVMQSVAEAAGVRAFGPSRSVSTTTAAVSGTIGLLPRVDIGSAALTNIPVLVLPDAQLTFENGTFKLPFILGLYPLALFDRIAWLDGGRLLALGDQAPPAGDDAVPAFWHPLGIGLPLDGPGGRLPAHFDTGSNSTYLFAPGLALVTPSERAALVQSTRRLGGVGGVATEDVRKLPLASLSLAGKPLQLRDVVVAPESKTHEAARLGDDIAARFGSVVLDFDRMVFSLGPPAHQGQ